MPLTRRHLLIGGGGAALAGAVLWMVGPVAGDGAPATLTPADLHTAVQAGEVLLVDIRQPEEWAQTGIATGAVPIDMRRPDFAEAVLAARAYEDQPIAVICARGVRSRRLAHAMTEAGLTPVIDVPEGMLGSFSGPGWIRAGLPLTNWSG